MCYLNVVFQEGGSLFPADENGKQLYSDVDYIETWPALEECVKLGLTKSIGLSNFSKDQTERILNVATIPPANNQVLFLYFMYGKLESVILRLIPEFKPN